MKKENDDFYDKQNRSNQVVENAIKRSPRLGSCRDQSQQLDNEKLPQRFMCYQSSRGQLAPEISRPPH